MSIDSITRQQWYIIESRQEHSPRVHIPWLRDIQRRLCCTEGRHLQSAAQLRPIDVVVEDDPEPDWIHILPLSYLHIIRRDLHDVLYPLLGDPVAVGGVVFPNGTRLPEFVSWNPSTIVRVRGSGRSTRHVCQACGLVSTFPMPTRSAYLLYEDVVHGGSVRLCQLWSILIEISALPLVEAISRHGEIIKEIPVRATAIVADR